MRRGLPFIIVGTVAILMIGGGTTLYRAKRPGSLTISPKASGKNGEEIHVLGNPNAPVTLEEFGDFECPPCGKMSEPINQLEHDFRPRLRVIFRHLPLIAHQHSTAAACASEAAALQGRFWPMHDVLYREQSVWSKATDVRPLFNSYAGILGLDVDRFKKDMESNEVKARVASDQREAARIGVMNTPTIFINNHALPPNETSPEGLRAAIESAVKEKPAS